MTRLRGFIIVLSALLLQVVGFFLSLVLGGYAIVVASIISFIASLIGGLLCARFIFAKNRVWEKGLNILGVILALNIAGFTLPLTGVAVIRWLGLEKIFI